MNNNEEKINDTCEECGYKFYFFFCESEVFPEIINCPICNKEYKVKNWYFVDK